MAMMPTRHITIEILVNVPDSMAGIGLSAVVGVILNLLLPNRSKPVHMRRT